MGFFLSDKNKCPVPLGIYNILNGVLTKNRILSNVKNTLGTQSDLTFVCDGKKPIFLTGINIAANDAVFPSFDAEISRPCRRSGQQHNPCVPTGIGLLFLTGKNPYF